MTTQGDESKKFNNTNDLVGVGMDLKRTGPIVVAGLYAQRVVSTALASGVDLAQLAKTAGFSEDSLKSLPEEIPGASYRALMQAAAVLSNDANFGLHVGERISPTS